MKITQVLLGLYLAIAAVAGSSPHGKALSPALAAAREIIMSKERNYGKVFSDEQVMRILERSLVQACAAGCMHEVRAFLSFGIGVDCQGNAPMKAAVRNGHAEIVRELIRCGAPINCGAFCARLVAAKMGYEHILKELPYEDASTPICEYCRQLSETFGEISLLSQEEIDAELLACPSPANATVSELPVVARSAPKAVPSCKAKIAARGGAPKGKACLPSDDAAVDRKPLGSKSTLGDRLLMSEVPPIVPSESLEASPNGKAEKEHSPRREAQKGRARAQQELLDASLEAAVATKNCKQIGILLAQGASRERYLVPVKASGRSKSKGPSKMRVATADEVQEAMDRALVETAASGSVKQMKDLLTGGANPRYNRDAPFKAAVDSNSSQAVLCLINAGAVFGEGTAGTMLAWASAENHYELVGKLSNLASISKAERDEALIQAVMNNSTKAARLLLESGADANYKYSISLVYAAHHDNPELAEMLLDHGAWHHFDQVVTLLHDPTALATKHEVKVFKSKGATTSKRHYNALMEAATMKHDRIVDLLVRRGSDVAALEDKAPTHALRTLSPEQFQTLLDGHKYSQASLTEALRATFLEPDNEAIAVLLLERGADPLTLALDVRASILRRRATGEDRTEVGSLFYAQLLLYICLAKPEPFIRDFVNQLGAESIKMSYTIGNLFISKNFAKMRFLFLEFNLPASILCEENDAITIFALIEHWDGVLEILKTKRHSRSKLAETLLLSVNSNRKDVWKALLDAGASITAVSGSQGRMTIAANANHLPSVRHLILEERSPQMLAEIIRVGLQYATERDLVDALAAALQIATSP